MANTFAPFGFRPSRLRGSAEPNFASMQPKPILYSNTNKMYWGDPVQITTAGYIDTLAPGSSTYYGIFQGCYYQDLASGQTVNSAWYPGAVGVSGSVMAFVNTDPGMLWEVQTGPGGVTFANIEQNVQFAYGTGSQTIGGISGAYIDTGTPPANTATLPFRVTNLILAPNNDNTLAANLIEVRFNNFLSNTSTGRS